MLQTLTNAPFSLWVGIVASPSICVIFFPSLINNFLCFLHYISPSGHLATEREGEREGGREGGNGAHAVDSVGLVGRGGSTHC